MVIFNFRNFRVEILFFYALKQLYNLLKILYVIEFFFSMSLLESKVSRKYFVWK